MAPRCMKQCSPMFPIQIISSNLFRNKVTYAKNELILFSSLKFSKILDVTYGVAGTIR